MKAAIPVDEYEYGGGLGAENYTGNNITDRLGEERRGAATLFMHVWTPGKGSGASMSMYSTANKSPQYCCRLGLG